MEIESRGAASVLSACEKGKARGGYSSPRKAHAHKVSRQLVNKYELIAFEDLNVRGMTKHHNLAKSIVDSGWSQLVAFTCYKAESAGRVVKQVNPRNTSQPLLSLR